MTQSKRDKIVMLKLRLEKEQAGKRNRESANRLRDEVHQRNMNNSRTQNFKGMKPVGVSGDDGENLPLNIVKNPTGSKHRKHHRNPTERHEFKSKIFGKPKQLHPDMLDIIMDVRQREKFLTPGVSQGNVKFTRGNRGIIVR